MGEGTCDYAWKEKMKTENKYIASLLSKLVKGKITPEEFLKLKDLAKDDPFLLDALEGYENHPGDHSAFIASLREELAKSTRKKNVLVSLPLWARVAASIAFIAVLSWFLLNQTRNGLQQPIAVADHVEIQSSEPGVDPISGYKEDLRASKNEPSATKLPAADILESSEISKSQKQEPGFESVIAPVVDQRKPNQEALNIKESISDDEERQLGKSAETKDEAAALRPETEQINVVPGEKAKITEAGDLGKKGDITITNAQDIKLEFDSRLELSSDRSSKFIDETRALQATEQKMEYIPGKDPDLSKAKPVNGFKLYKKYLKENTVYPAAAMSDAIEGEVKVQFSVSPDGKTMDFIILESLGFGCDEEAIRLIKEGPKWETDPPGMKVTYTFSIPFEK